MMPAILVPVAFLCQLVWYGKKMSPGCYWLQTLPIVWDRLLDKPYRRTIPYLTDAAPGVIP